MKIGVTELNRQEYNAAEISKYLTELDSEMTLACEYARLSRRLSISTHEHLLNIYSLMDRLSIALGQPFESSVDMDELKAEILNIV